MSRIVQIVENDTAQPYLPRWENLPPWVRWFAVDWLNGDVIASFWDKEPEFNGIWCQQYGTQVFTHEVKHAAYDHLADLQPYKLQRPEFA